MQYRDPTRKPRVVHSCRHSEGSRQGVLTQKPEGNFRSVLFPFLFEEGGVMLMFKGSLTFSCEGRDSGGPYASLPRAPWPVLGLAFPA